MTKEMTLSIDEDYWPLFIAGLLNQHPILTEAVLDDKGNPTFDKNKKPITKPEYDDITWVKMIAMNYLKKEVKYGLQMLAVQKAGIDEKTIDNIIKTNLE